MIVSKKCFDTNKLKTGTVIRIRDIQPIVPMTSRELREFEERGEEYFNTNLSGNYLVNDCTSDSICIINCIGKMFNLHTGYFTDEFLLNDNSKITRMTMDVLDK